MVQQDSTRKLVRKQLNFFPHRPACTLLPSPPIVIGGRGPEAPRVQLRRLEVRQRRGPTADGLGERPLGTEVGRREGGVDHALETVSGGVSLSFRFLLQSKNVSLTLFLGRVSLSFRFLLQSKNVSSTLFLGCVSL